MLIEVHPALPAAGGRVEFRRQAVKAAERVLQVLALNETHGVIRPAVRVSAQPVHRHDAGMLQSARDLRLLHEAGAARHRRPERTESP